MHLYFYPIADRYWVVAAICAALLGVVVLVGPGRKRASLPRRIILAGLRCLIILLIVLGMLRPTLVYIETHKEKATLVLLIDQSRSLQVRDALNNKSRWESLRLTLEDCVPALRRLGGEFEIKVYTFDAETHPLEIKDGRVALPDVPVGQQTAIGAALDDVLRQENGKRLLGIVLLTDGRQQALPPRDLPAQEVSNQLRHQGYKVYPVPFGESRGLGGVQDVAITDFPPPSAVFVNTEMAVRGQVKIIGYLNKEIPVRLLMGESDKSMKVIGETKLKASENGQILPVEFKYIPDTPGEFKLTLEAIPQPGELVTTNNRQSSFVQVLKGGLHVLYIEGDLRVEQKFLRRSLDASRDIKVDSIRIDPQHVKETKPGDLAEIFKAGKYDVYILGDVDSTVFTDAELKELKTSVEGGKGLIMLGGFHAFGPGGYYNTALADVLPVVMDRLERQGLKDETIRSDVHLKGPLQMLPAPRELRHFVMTLAASPEANKEAWEKLPPLEGANLFSDARLKAGAIVLANADGKEQFPLLVTQTADRGRVIAFAGDSTWRWWMHGFQSAHKRFWRQIVLWLARKDQENQGNVWVRLDNTRYFTGNRVEFSAGAHTPQNEPITDAEFKVEIVKPGNKIANVVMVSKEDHMTGSFRDTQQPGDYTIRVTASRKGELLGPPAQAQFIVAEQDLELDNASSDPDAMKGVARASGGEIIRAEMLPKWLDELMKKTDFLEVKQETKKTLWDSWNFFFAVLTILTIEWYLRKKWGLV
jgi:uncharacterized membrane protein